MSGRFLLDTNILIGFFGQDSSIVDAVSKAREVLIPSIVIGELYYGAFNSGKPEQNVQKIDAFKTQVPILSSDSETAKFYGQIKFQLRTSGTPIPENDIWIAALSIQHNLPLVSKDKHFQKVNGLQIVVW